MEYLRKLAYMKEQKLRTLHYRKAFLLTDMLAKKLDPPITSLENALLESIYIIEKNGKDFTRPLDNNDKIETLDANNGGLEEIFGLPGHTGIIYSTRKGDKVAASKSNDGKYGITLGQPKDISNEEIDPATDIIYFAVYENDIAYFSDNKEADRKLENYFNWLLKTKTTTISGFHTIKLQSTISKKCREQIKSKGIKEIYFNSKTKADILANLGEKLNYCFFHSLENPIISDESYSVLKDCPLAVSIKAGSDDKEKRQETLACYCSQLTDSQLVELKLTLGDGTVIKEGEVVTTGKKTIDFEHGVVNQISAKRILLSWLNEIRNKGSID